MVDEILESTPHEASLALARFVKKTRLDQNMPLAELCLRVGASRTTLTKLELQGEGSIDTVTKVFAALGVLDLFFKMFVPKEKQQSLAELKKSATKHTRLRGRRTVNGIS